MPFLSACRKIIVNTEAQKATAKTPKTVASTTPMRCLIVNFVLFMI